MSDVFKTSYAEAYDYFYATKDYISECDLIESVLKKNASFPVHSILDMGCGTGNHSIPLAEREYSVVGVDRSEPMIKQAQKKAEKLLKDASIEFHIGDIKHVELGRSFDAVLMMFAVLGYQIKNADVIAALQCVRKHIRLGGLFIFDVWYGPAVLAEKPSARIKHFSTQNRKIIRLAQGDLDTLTHTCKVNYRTLQIEKDCVKSDEEEQHLMRFFFPMELDILLSQTNFALVQMGAFPDIERKPDETTWNILVVAKAV